jgi:hypothetical protein
VADFKAPYVRAWRRAEGLPRGNARDKGFVRAVSGPRRLIGFHGVEKALRAPLELLVVELNARAHHVQINAAAAAYRLRDAVEVRRVLIDAVEVPRDPAPALADVRVLVAVEELVLEVLRRRRVVREVAAHEAAEGPDREPVRGGARNGAF